MHYEYVNRELMPFYLTMPSVLEPTGAESRYGPGASNKNERSEKRVARSDG